MTEPTPGPWHMATPSMGFSALYGADGRLIFGIAYGSQEERRSEEECVANAKVVAAAWSMREALLKARQFIVNGIELGFIRMPDPSTPDPAHQTLPAIDAALAIAAPDEGAKS